MTQAIILAGGKGTRLHPLTSFKPKPLLDVGGRPFIEHQIEWLKEYGVREIILSTGYRAEAFRSLAGGEKYGVKIQVVSEDEPLGTAGAAGNCRHLINEDYFLVLNGDIYAELDLAPLLQQRRVCTIVSYLVDGSKSYGTLETEGDKIVNFREKGRDLINAGIYHCHRDIFTYITPGRYLMFETDVFPELARRGQLYHLNLAGYWIDIGTIDRYLEVNRYLAGKLSAGGS